MIYGIISQTSKYMQITKHLVKNIGYGLTYDLGWNRRLWIPNKLLVTVILLVQQPQFEKQGNAAHGNAANKHMPRNLGGRLNDVKMNK